MAKKGKAAQGEETEMVEVTIDKPKSTPLTGKCTLPGAKALTLAGEPFGRPTDYRPEMCHIVVDLGRQGYSKAMIAAHAEIDVARVTLDRWCDEHVDFCHAMLRARELALAWWESQGNMGIWSREFNANAYRLQVTNRFPDDWRDKQEVDTKHSGSIGTPELNVYVNGVLDGSDPPPSTA